MRDVGQHAAQGPAQTQGKSPLAKAGGHLHPGTDFTALKPIVPCHYVEATWRELGAGRLLSEAIGVPQGVADQIFP